LDSEKISDTMKTITAFFLMLTTIMVTTALAAPVINMYDDLDESNCQVCHTDKVLLGIQTMR
jgi:hypothetical protein